MSTRTPKAWETTWAQEAIRAERDRPADEFRYAEDERQRVDQVKSSAANPEGVSDRILAAPARGPVLPFRDTRILPDGDGFKVVDAPYRSGCPGRTRDAFDAMTDQATRRGGNAPFTVAQVGAARDYRALDERVQSAGVKCSKVFDVQTGGQGRIDFMDAYIRDTERLVMFHDAIGSVIAKDMKRVSPSKAQRVIVTDDMLAQVKKRIITVRTLVDDVCIKDRTLSDVLKAHGWSVTGKNRKALRDALCAALGRMQGI